MAVQQDSFHLMDLPQEILMCVMSHLDIKSLINATLVSKLFDDLAEPYLYSTQKILYGRNGRILSKAILNNPHRARWINSFLVSTKFGNESGLETLPRHIREMRNLKSLRLETPDCNSFSPEQRIPWILLQDRYERIFSEASTLAPNPSHRPLPKLEECTIHFVDNKSELYSLPNYASLFLHPTLKSLTISCTSTDFPSRYPDFFKLDSQLKGSTALENLHLEESDIFPETLELLLSLPRALKSLKISEGIRYDGNYRTGSSRLHGNVSPPELMEALSKTCAESLESLSLSLGHRRRNGQEINHRKHHLDMTMMKNLKHLEVDKSTLALLRPSRGCDHNTYLRLPPNLESMKVIAINLGPRLPFEPRRNAYVPLESCFVRDKAKHGVPNLKKVTFSYDHYDDTEEQNMLAQSLLNPHAFTHDAEDLAQSNSDGDFSETTEVQGEDRPTNDPDILALFDNPDVIAAMNNNPQLALLGQQLLSNHHLRRSPRSRDFTQTQLSKISLLNLLNGEILPHYRQSNTQLQINLVQVPRGFIPPYLYPEDKPVVIENWWNSSHARETDEYRKEMKLERECRMFERNLLLERNRRRQMEARRLSTLHHTPYDVHETLQPVQYPDSDDMTGMDEAEVEFYSADS